MLKIDRDVAATFVASHFVVTIGNCLLANTAYRKHLDELSIVIGAFFCVTQSANFYIVYLTILLPFTLCMKIYNI